MEGPDGLARVAVTDQIELQPVRPGKPPWILRSEGELFWFEPADGGRVVEIPREEAARKLEILPTWGRNAALVVRPNGKKLHFKLTADQRERLEGWLGSPTEEELRAHLKRRYAFTAPIGVLFMLTSLPVAGNPAAGIEPLPFSPVSFGLGLGLVLLWLHARLYPEPYLFALDSAWFGLLALSVLVDVLRGGSSAWWLLWVAIFAPLIPAGLKQYRRFRSL